MIKSESIVNLAAALVRAQRKMVNAKKDAKNLFFKSTYANLNSVREAVTPALNEEGISVLQLMIHHSEKNFVRTTLLHESGEYVCSDTEIVVKEANNPQALGSAISYARRYGLSSATSSGAEDDDGEAAVERKPNTTNPFGPKAEEPVQKKSTNSFVPPSNFRKNV